MIKTVVQYYLFIILIVIQHNYLYKNFPDRYAYTYLCKFIISFKHMHL